MDVPESRNSSPNRWKCSSSLKCWMKRKRTCFCRRHQKSSTEVPVRFGFPRCSRHHSPSCLFLVFPFGSRGGGTGKRGRPLPGCGQPTPSAGFEGGWAGAVRGSSRATPGQASILIIMPGSMISSQSPGRIMAPLQGFGRRCDGGLVGVMMVGAGPATVKLAMADSRGSNVDG